MIVPTAAGKKEASVILDTNILQYINCSAFLEDLLRYLDSFVDSGKTLKVSETSIMEILSGYSVKQEKEVFDVLARFPKQAVSEEILVTAGRLQNIYRTYGIEDTRISLADRIIASTAYVTGSDLITADVNDFPRPVFKEKHEELFYYRRRNKTNIQVVQVLSPNIDLMTDY